MNSNAFHITITPRDPIIARDGRPFNHGQRMRSLDWIYPSVFAGSLRTLIGKQLGMKFDPTEVETLKSLEIAGPFPLFNEKVFVSKPLDCIVEESEKKEKKQYTARPANLRNGEGTNLPNGLLPVILSEKKGEEFKPAQTAPFWSFEKMVEWLATPVCCDEVIEEKEGESVLDAFEQEERTHVALTPETGTAKDSMLFSTTGLDFEKKKGTEIIRMVAEITTPESLSSTIQSLNALHPLGGERRLVHWKTDGKPFHDATERLRIFSSNKLVRMVLATPAIFRHGWLPGWINETTFQGAIPGTGVTGKLIGASVERWQPISGWSYENNQPKPVRRLVPAGSVYFFELEEGDFGQLLNKAWIKSVCDNEQDQRDGFGLALWGIWDYNEPST